jgi:hypothetical protein
MPAGSSRRSNRRAAQAGLLEAKSALLSAIHQLSQLPGNTDLESPLDAALNILRSHPQATSRMLIMGSDFLKDTGRGQVSMDPPATVHDRTAAGVVVLLLVTYPKPEYLSILRVSYSHLYENIQTKWTTFLKHKNASAVTVRLVDAVPVTVRTIPASQK